MGAAQVEIPESVDETRRKWILGQSPYSSNFAIDFFGSSGECAVEPDFVAPNRCYDWIPIVAIGFSYMNVSALKKLDQPLGLRTRDWEITAISGSNVGSEELESAEIGDSESKIKECVLADLEKFSQSLDQHLSQASFAQIINSQLISDIFKIFSEIKPHFYLTPDGGIAVDFLNGENRITVIVDEYTIHILATKKGKVFEEELEIDAELEQKLKTVIRRFL